MCVRTPGYSQNRVLLPPPFLCTPSNPIFQNIALGSKKEAWPLTVFGFEKALLRLHAVITVCCAPEQRPRDRGFSNLVTHQNHPGSCRNSWCLGSTSRDWDCQQDFLKPPPEDYDMQPRLRTTASDPRNVSATENFPDLLLSFHMLYLVK